MKTLRFITILLMLGIAGSLQAQIKINLKDKLKKETNKRANKKTDEAIDKSFDKVEEGIEGVFEDDENKDEKSETREDQTSTNENATENNNHTTEADDSKVSNKELKAWTKYDFVPGDVVIFEDQLTDEENGEFPSKWDLKQGNVEIAKLGDENVINFASTHNSIIVPLLTETGDYLPDQFTVELDVYFSEFCTRYKVHFYDLVNQDRGDNNAFVYITPDYVSVEGFSGTSIRIESDAYPFWKHMAIAFNIRSLKVYYGEQRVMNIPNLRSNPSGITISSSQCHAPNQAMIKNIRIAKGGKKLYDRILTDGKIVTNGIRFDFGKATLRPESMGVINEIYNLMKEHEDLSFSVEGHTDNVGDGDANLKLSEARAESVMHQLIEMGISKGRLSAKGYGESTPIADNGTPEGRANNRRVEFVKM